MSIGALIATVAMLLVSFGMTAIVNVLELDIPARSTFYTTWGICLAFGIFSAFTLVRKNNKQWGR